VHVALLPDDEVCLIDGLAVTHAARTVVDIARSVPFESAICVADAALRRRRCTPGQLRDCLTRMGPVPGSRRAARVLAFADGRSDSVGRAGAECSSTVSGCPHLTPSAGCSARTAR
jgi:hypothetical protein